MPADLRPCPFCAHDRPERVTIGGDAIRVLFITCPECGAIGPRADGKHPPGTAGRLWNLRLANEG